MNGLSEGWGGVRRTGCRCGNCRRCWSDGRRVERLARESLSAALAHAQHGRFETSDWSEADNLGGASRPVREAGPYGRRGARASISRW